MHNQTVGSECARCHTPNSWIVNNITEIHQRSRFPLVGPHRTADCYACHKNASASLLNFGPLGVECFDCHQANYASTTNPNHATAGYSHNCTDCHSMNSFTWGTNVDHSFFPPVVPFQNFRQNASPATRPTTMQPPTQTTVYCSFRLIVSNVIRLIQVGNRPPSIMLFLLLRWVTPVLNAINVI